MARTHQKIVTECAIALYNAGKEGDIEKYMNILNRYGKKTREEAIQMNHERRANEMGMTLEEYKAWLESDD